MRRFVPEKPYRYVFQTELLLTPLRDAFPLKRCYIIILKKAKRRAGNSCFYIRCDKMICQRNLII